MGFRFRRSINLGGGFRINLSGSGIGYSWGVKGFRITKTSKGATRMTASIPGTGISYVEESGVPNQPSPNHNQSSISNNEYDTRDIVNTTATLLVSDGLEDLLFVAKNALEANQITTVGIWISTLLSLYSLGFVVLLIFFICLKIYVKTKGLINLDYTIDTDQCNIIEQRMKPMINVTKSDSVWRIIQSSKVIDQKYSAGASNTVKRTICRATQKSPFPFRTNTSVATFQSGKETLVFLPDKLFIIQGSKIGALNYCDITTSAHTRKFIESERVPKDADIVDYTWQYVNKSGGPDKRFKNNRRLSICQYGELELKSTSGLNTVVMFSNTHLI